MNNQKNVKNKYLRPDFKIKKIKTLLFFDNTQDFLAVNCCPEVCVSACSSCIPVPPASSCAL